MQGQDDQHSGLGKRPKNVGRICLPPRPLAPNLSDYSGSATCLSLESRYRPQLTLIKDVKLVSWFSVGTDCLESIVNSCGICKPSSSPIVTRTCQKKFSSLTLVTVPSILIDRVVLSQREGSASSNNVVIMLIKYSYIMFLLIPRTRSGQSVKTSCLSVNYGRQLMPDHPERRLFVYSFTFMYLTVFTMINPIHNSTIQQYSILQATIYS